MLERKSSRVVEKSSAFVPRELKNAILPILRIKLKHASRRLFAIAELLVNFFIGDPLSAFVNLLHGLQKSFID